jgi:mono/diheme cytochrome c family protein
MRNFYRIALLCAAAGLVASAADVNNGKALYAKACKSCHGAAGEGNPAIAKATKVELRHLGSAEVQKLSDADLSKAISAGVGKMKPVASVKGSEPDIVAFMRTLKK